MNDKNLIKDGSALSDATLICYFKMDNGKKYAYYTLNDTDASSPTVKVHVAVIKQADSSLNTQINDNEWATLKGIMGNVVQGNDGDNVTYLKPNADLEIDNEKVIAMPVTYDYVKKHTDVYNSKAVDDTDANASEAPESVESPAAAAPGVTPATDTQTPASPELSGFTNLTPEPEKEVPKVSEPVPEATNNFGNVIPSANENDAITPVTEEPALETPVMPEEPTGAPVSTPSVNIDTTEIQNKCNELISTVTKLTEEIMNLVNSLSSASTSASDIASAPAGGFTESPIPAATPVQDIAPAPAQEAPAAAPAANQPAATPSFETNWFDVQPQ